MGTTSRIGRSRLAGAAALALFFLAAPPLIASGPPDLGQWSGPYAWPCVGIHTHVLPDGKILSWADDDNPNYPADGTRLGGSSKVYVIDVPADGRPGAVLEDDNSNTVNGFIVRGDLRVADSLQSFVGYSDAPEISEGVINVWVHHFAVRHSGRYDAQLPGK